MINRINPRQFAGFFIFSPLCKKLGNEITNIPAAIQFALDIIQEH